MLSHSIKAPNQALQRIGLRRIAELGLLTSHAMTQTQKQCWELERAKGEARFVLREGPLRCGLPFATIGTIAPLLYDIFTHRPLELSWELAIAFAFYTVAFGGCMGTMAWRGREREFQKPTNDEDVV